MESLDTEKILANFEDLAGNLKDSKDLNTLITNILKKKNAKNKTEIIIQFLDNLNLIKPKLKANKKLEKSAYTIIVSENNGEEKFIKNFIAKLEERSKTDNNSCANLLNSLFENKEKFKNFGNLIAQRLRSEGHFFQEYFKTCADHAALLQALFKSKFKEENLIHHFIEFWNSLAAPSYDKEAKDNSNKLADCGVFADLKEFKALFLSAFKKAVLMQNYSFEFIEEIKKKKTPKEIDSLLNELGYANRIKIDSFLAEYDFGGGVNLQAPLALKCYKSFLNNLFESKKDKQHLIENFFENLEFMTKHYDKEKFMATVFEELFTNENSENFENQNSNKNKNLISINNNNNNKNFENFYAKLAEVYCENAYALNKKCPKLFNILLGLFLEKPSFTKQTFILKTVTKLKHKAIISLFEEIASSNYANTALNLLQYCINEKNLEEFALLLQAEKISEDILNYFLIESNLHRAAPIMDTITASSDAFFNNLIEEILKVNKFPKQKALVLTSFSNCYTKITTAHSNSIQNIKEQFKLSERKKIRFLYSRYLAYEIDLYFLLDFFAKNDFENLSLIANRLIRSEKYHEALKILIENQFNERIYIEKEHEDELIVFLHYPQNSELKPKKRKLRYSNNEQSINFSDFNDFNNHDADYDETYDEFLDNENSDQADNEASDREAAEIDDAESVKTSKSKNANKKKYKNQSSRNKIIDYIMHFEYKKSCKLNKAKYLSALGRAGYLPIPNRADCFAPVSPYTLAIDIPRENIFFIDSIQDLKNLQSLANRKFAIDFEYADEVISLIQISDNKYVYLIDYLRLIQNSDFFSVFNAAFKNCVFLAFDMGSSDLNLLHNNFKEFFTKAEVLDLKKIYEEKLKQGKSPSLANMALMFLGKPLCKYFQCSKWDKRPLLEGQVHYAAMDSQVLFKLYEALEDLIKKEEENKNRFDLFQNISAKEKKDLKGKIIKDFAQSQINFLQAERQMVEEANKSLMENSMDEIMQTHKVIRHVRFDEHNEKEKVYSFSYSDILSLIKKDEKIGLFEILDDNQVKEIAVGVIETITVNSITIGSMKFSKEIKIPLKKFFKGLNFCLIQLSDDTFKSMVRAMQKLQNLQIPKHCLDIVKLCFPTQSFKPDCSSLAENTIKDKEIIDKRLDKYQKEVLNFSLSTDLPISLIYGPPGTGKSKTIKEIVFQSIKKNKKVLVTAFSNAGCDNLASMFNSFTFPEELKKEKNFSSAENFLRVGKTSKINQDIKQISLEEKTKACFYSLCLERVKQSLYSREDQQLVDSRIADLNEKLNKFAEILIGKASVIFSTCVSSGSFLMRKFSEKRKGFFDLAIIDEASQALEAACWIPILQAKKVVIVGDFNQIGPVVNTNTQLSCYTLFERMYNIHGEKLSKMLRIQYRMHEKIMKFPSLCFYENNLIAGEEVASRTLRQLLDFRRMALKNFHKHVNSQNQNQSQIQSQSQNISFSNNCNLIQIDNNFNYYSNCFVNDNYNFNNNNNNNEENDLDEFQYFDPLNILSEPLILIKTDGNCAEEKISTSKYNLGEAKIVKQIVNYLKKNGVDNQNIGIITPYGAQVNCLQRLLNFSIDVATVDSFQGSEREVIILSFVRSNVESQVGFLSDKKRINVAVTRAKKMLVLICDADTLKGNKFMEKLVNFYFKNAKVFSSEEINGLKI